MTHFIFKSANRLIKNEPITFVNLMDKLKVMQSQLRLLRSDNANMNGKLDRLLIDKHLQMQVDEYFEHDGSPTSEPSKVIEDI